LGGIKNAFFDDPPSVRGGKGEGDSGGTKNPVNAVSDDTCVLIATAGDGGGTKKALVAFGLSWIGPGESGGIKNGPAFLSPGGEGGGTHNAASVLDSGDAALDEVTRCFFSAGLRSIIFQKTMLTQRTNRSMCCTLTGGLCN
jgi:hypothetical protein